MAYIPALKYRSPKVQEPSTFSPLLWASSLYEYLILCFFTLVGQFWNVPMTLQPYQYDGPLPTALDVDSLYSVCISHPSGPSSDRKFIAEYFTRKWDLSTATCFYSGNIQGGKLLEIEDTNFNDPVIEGQYTEYIVQGLFKNSFKYSQFSHCDEP